MPRIRTIKPEFPEDETLGRVSRDARLLFVLIWTRADDLGRFRASPAYLRGQLFPFDAELSTQDVAAWLAELEASGCVRSYIVREEHYAVVTNWGKHQRVDNAGRSLWPPPPFAETRGDSPRFAADLGESRSESKPSQTDGESHGSRQSRRLAATRGDSPLDHDHDLDQDLDHDHYRVGARQPDSEVAEQAGLAEEVVEDGLKNQVGQALDVLARRQLERARSKGMQVTNVRGLLDKIRRDVEHVDGAALAGLVAEHPDWPAEAIADAIDRPTIESRPTSALSEDEALRQHMRLVKGSGDAS